MDPNKAFELLFPGLIENKVEQDQETWDLSEMPYKLSFKAIKNTSTYKCTFCAQGMCDDCLVPYSDKMTIKQVMEQVKIDGNTNHFKSQSYYAGAGEKDLQVNLVWHQDIEKRLFDFLLKVQSFEKQDQEEASRGGLSLIDCLKDFKQTEILDEDNMWYCSKCQEHVQAKKTLELFKVPRILVISFKRFKTTRKISWGGSKKIDSHIDFPLEGLDMSPYVLSEEQKKSGPLIYDCYAVSNHFGGLGGGHYTAYAKNIHNDTWYDFDDSHASPVSSPQNVITSAAYSLFYRLRDHVQDVT